MILATGGFGSLGSLVGEPPTTDQSSASLPRGGGFEAAFGLDPCGPLLIFRVPAELGDEGIVLEAGVDGLA